MGVGNALLPLAHRFYRGQGASVAGDEQGGSLDLREQRRDIHGPHIAKDPFHHRLSSFPHFLNPPFSHSGADLAQTPSHSRPGPTLHPFPLHLFEPARGVKRTLRQGGRSANDDQTFYGVGIIMRKLHSYATPYPLPDDMHGSNLQLLEEPLQIFRQSTQGPLIIPGWKRRLAEAAEVGAQHPELPG